MVDVELKPWREKGDHILVLPQRGVGPPGVAMPQGWADRTRKILKRTTKRPIHVRPHPGRNPCPLEPDLKNCWAAVTWGSGAGIKAICAGIPVFYEFPAWIGGSAARPYCKESIDIENPYTGNRDPMLLSLSWAQWTVHEIAEGTPFKLLLGTEALAHAV
jgi:hypothetical protein